MIRWKWAPITSLTLLACVLWPHILLADRPVEGSHGHQHESKPSPQPTASIEILDEVLQDQEGQPVRFKSDVVGGYIVVMNFIYTTCKTQCPLNSQVMSQVQKNLPESQRDLVRLVSLSIDPGTDTPQRLKHFASDFGAGPGWTWLTGQKPTVNQVLNALGVYTPDFVSHPSVILVGDAKSGQWTRFNGFANAAQLLARVDDFVKARTLTQSLATTHKIKSTSPTPSDEERDNKARDYFTDLQVVTHEGKKLRFYSDLLKDKIVLVNLFYTKCKDGCPITNAKLALLQKMLAEDMGKNLFFISVTLDPDIDTLETLKKYSAEFKPQPGWYFVTGSPENIKTITRRLGQTDEDIRAHSPMLLLGDVKRAKWKKLMPNIPSKSLAKALHKLASDSHF